MSLQVVLLQAYTSTQTKVYKLPNLKIQDFKPAGYMQQMQRPAGFVYIAAQILIRTKLQECSIAKVIRQFF